MGSREAIARLEGMILMAGFNLPFRAIRQMIVGAVDVIQRIASTAPHEAADSGHQLVRLLGGVAAGHAVARVVVQQSERDFVQCRLHG